MAFLLAEVRNAVLAWAHGHGVLADTVSAAAEIAEGDPSILPFGAEHADYFRTRKIVRVYGITGRTRHELKIFARLKVAKTKVEELKRLFDAEFATSQIRLTVDISKPFKVDQAVQSYGRFDPIRRVGDRIACGSSVGIGNQRNAGTLTAIVRYRGDPEHLYGISCNHVVGGCSTARPGTPVVVPGIQDVSADHDEINLIGVHFSAAPMSQGLPSVFDISPNRDLACFRLTDPDRVTSIQGGGEHAYDTPLEHVRPKVGTAVKKWGRSTGLTYGRISNILTGGEPIDYNVTSYYGPMNSQVFKGTVYFEEIYEVDPANGPGSQGGPFSLGGDSGALVVSHRSGQPERIVGIVVAGGRDKSLLLPLKPALKTLDLEIVSGH